MDDQSLVGFASSDYFFSAELECQFCSAEALPCSKTFLLPELSRLFNEESFATVSMGWNHNGLLWRIEVVRENEISVAYPEITQGDSIELFIDTRDVKSARTTHRFCHHFFFLPEAVDGLFCGEISKFRTEDSHLLCKSEDLDCVIESSKAGYLATIAIPKQCLVGFDPTECSKIGCSYRINRSKGLSQHLGLSGYPIERHPYLWNTLRLVGEKI